ncbi:MAG: hypothetical protein EBT15_05575 [Betaproteobacteria bacterium]|nr:hypothetical protein [Betaproteobacteria bacterium]
MNSSETAVLDFKDSRVVDFTWSQDINSTVLAMGGVTFDADEMTHRFSGPAVIHQSINRKDTVKGGDTFIYKGPSGWTSMDLGNASTTQTHVFWSESESKAHCGGRRIVSYQKF